jgi:hypothetical protein
MNQLQKQIIKCLQGDKKVAEKRVKRRAKKVPTRKSLVTLATITQYFNFACEQVEPPFMFCMYMLNRETSYAYTTSQHAL